ncbi:MAG TPA: DUF5658 family protein [Candidatus Cloacimonadota bacterium]|nr:DUF5658 family protein [Candidatus Cloacimonadota bacterium]
MAIFQSAHTLYVLFGIYAVLNVMDGISTWLVLRPDHFEREANPVARFIFLKLGIPNGIIITEAAVLAILSPLIFWLAGTQPEIAVVLLLAADLVFLWVVTDNLRIALRYRRKALLTKNSGLKRNDGEGATASAGTMEDKFID